jgi:hypothetical protein
MKFTFYKYFLSFSLIISVLFSLQFNPNSFKSKGFKCIEQSGSSLWLIFINEIADNDENNEKDGNEIDTKEIVIAEIVDFNFTIFYFKEILKKTSIDFFTSPYIELNCPPPEC